LPQQVKTRKSANMNEELINEKEVVEESKSAEQVKEETASKQETQSKGGLFSKKAKKPKKESKEEELQKKYDEANDKYLRLAAEFDNYKKRTLKERMELIKTAGENILVGLIPIIDDFDRAMQATSQAKDIEAVKQGLGLIYNKFNEFIKQKGIKEIEAISKDFDTDLHEAITKIPAPTAELKGKVVDVVEKGYFLNDKVIRYSKVVIGE